MFIHWKEKTTAALNNVILILVRADYVFKYLSFLLIILNIVRKCIYCRLIFFKGLRENDKYQDLNFVNKPIFYVLPQIKSWLKIIARF